MPRSSDPPRRRRSPTLALGTLLLLSPLLVGWHWHRLGWTDEHDNYPKRPSGYAQIVNVFGEPCSDAAHAVWMDWYAPDDEKTYRVWFHRKLGGRGTAMVSDKGGRSTNLDNDVYGHIRNQHLEGYALSGIWGYACRYISGTTKWSTHAWGIAVDVSARYEHYPSHYHSHVNFHHADVWTNHRWYWGRAFGDAMHFQYADSY
jgi:hypothetical protein